MIAVKGNKVVIVGWCVKVLTFSSPEHAREWVKGSGLLYVKFKFIEHLVTPAMMDGTYSPTLPVGVSMMHTGAV